MIYEYLVETKAGQYTQASPIDIDLVDFTAGDLAISRFVFYAPGHPDFPRIVIDVRRGMKLIHTKLVLHDHDFLDCDQSHKPLENRLTRLPLRSFWCIGFTWQGRTVINRVDFKTKEVQLDMF